MALAVEPTATIDAGDDQLALGVAGSALYSLLAYFANMISFSFSSAESSSDPVKGAARYELLEAVEQGDRSQFTKVLGPLPQLVGLAVYKQVSKHDQFNALLAELDGVADAHAQESSTMATSWSDKMRAWFGLPPAAARSAIGESSALKAQPPPPEAPNFPSLKPATSSGPSSAQPIHHNSLNSSLTLHQLSRADRSQPRPSNRTRSPS